MDIVTLALSKKYTNARLENLATTGFTPVVVDVLPEPTQANSGNLYLVPANDPKDENKYLEYLVDGRKVKSFGVPIEEGLILPIVEKGYINLYIRGNV